MTSNWNLKFFSHIKNVKQKLYIRDLQYPYFFYPVWKYTEYNKKKKSYFRHFFT